MPSSRDTDRDRSRISSINKGKVIDLQGYLSAERALDLLATTPLADPQFARRLTEAVACGPSVPAVAARRVDAFKPLELESLGLVVAAYRKRAEAVSQMLKVAHDRRNSDARRLGASLLLEYFLDVPPADDLLATLRDPALALGLSFAAVVRQSLGLRVLRNYVQSLMFQPSDLLYMVFNRLLQEDELPLEVARLMSLHPDEELSLSVVEALAGQGSRQALSTLAALEPSLSRTAGHAALRAIQKMRLAGYSPRMSRPNMQCRALLGPIDGSGNRLLVLIAPTSVEDTAAKTGALTLEMYLSEMSGVADAVEYETTGGETPPHPAKLGHLHRYTPRVWGEGLGSWPLGGAAEPVAAALEVSYLYGLQVLREAVAKNWLSQTPLPLSYCLYSHHFWQFSERPEDSAGEIEEPEQWHTERFVGSEADLLLNPVLSSWYLTGDSAQEVAQEISALNGDAPRKLTDDNWKLLLPALIRLAHDEFGTEVRARYARRLRSMSEWFRMSGQFHEAACAASAAHTMLKSPPETNLLVLRMVQRGILVALDRLASRGS